MNWRAMVMGVVAIVCAPVAWAQRPPETHPVSEQRDIVMTWDRSAMPGDIELLSKTVLGFSTNPAYQYGRLHLVCESASDASRGRCPISGIEDTSLGLAKIPLQLTETRSGARVEIDVQGGLNRGLASRACGLSFWMSVYKSPWNSSQEVCAGESMVGTRADLLVPTSALTRLVAGVWKGQLVLYLHSDPTAAEIASYTFNFEFTITDNNAAAIYLPEFGHATPTVGLNLRYDPFAHTLSGSKLVDVCLYDGLGSQSQYLGLTVRDSSGRPLGPTGFSVWHDDGGSDARRRLDYTLTLDHAGTRVPLVNGQEHQLRNIDSVPLRLVMLPGMTYPVYCVPTPITFQTPTVPSTSKDAGHYGGSLHVELRIPTTSP